MALRGVIKAAHEGNADFGVRGKILATLGYRDDQWGMVRLAPEEQAKRVRQAPAVFVPAKGAWGEQGSTLGKLEAASAGSVRPGRRPAWGGLGRGGTAAHCKGGRPGKTERVKGCEVVKGG